MSAYVSSAAVSGRKDFFGLPQRFPQCKVFYMPTTGSFGPVNMRAGQFNSAEFRTIYNPKTRQPFAHYLRSLQLRPDDSDANLGLAKL